MKPDTLQGSPKSISNPSSDARFRVHADALSCAADLVGHRKPFALATVIATDGSVSAAVGSKAVIDEEGTILVGWVGGGCAQSTVAQAAIDSLESGEGQLVDLDLNDEVLGTGMPCGGTMRVYVDPVRPRTRLWILGHGRIVECLCCLAALMDLEVVIDDPQASPERYPDARLLLTNDDNYRALTPAADDFVVVATQHKGDHQSMRRLLETDVSYIGLIASHKRSQLIFDYLREFDPGGNRIACIRAPAGLDLLAESPEEIALSVMSEIVRIRNARKRKTADRNPASQIHEMKKAG
jgi:xanthine dehydrogenase accessory factor